MGYDMTAVREMDAADAAEHANAEALFREAVSGRDALPRGTNEREQAQADVESALREMYAANKAYFRLNITGMGQCCDIMQKFGMLCDTPSRGFEWPAPPDDSWYEWLDGMDGARPPRDGDGTPEQVAWARAYIRHLREHRGECPGIPDHKFSSNDGWIVTPAEIKAALTFHDAHTSEQAAAILAGFSSWWRDEGWAQWIDWLRRTGAGDGFRVH